MKTWLSTTADGKYTIKRVSCPHPGVPVDLGKPRVGVLHTTETFNSAIAGVFKQHYAPHFEVGPGSITQLVPLGMMASSLENHPDGVETNRWAIVQIETIGHSQDHPYSFDAKTEDALASLLATLNAECGIPLSRPYPDGLPAKPWATPSFSRRRDGKWGHVAGWYGHIEVPENEHWDPGWLNWSHLLGLAKTRRGRVVPMQRHFPKPPSPMPGWWWDWADWRRNGRIDSRPPNVPRLIPLWAWGALVAYNKKHPPT